MGAGTPRRKRTPHSQGPRRAKAAATKLATAIGGESHVSELHHDIILTPPYDIAAHPTEAHNIEDVKVTAPRRPRIRRLVGICVSGVCVAATTAMAIEAASANPHPEKHGSHASAQQLQREMRSLRGEGFVATSCTVGGTLMTNYSTNQSVLVKGGNRVGRVARIRNLRA